MNTLLITSVLMVALFMGATIWHRRHLVANELSDILPDSVSAMVYELPVGGWRWLWMLWLWAVALTLAPPLLTAMPDTWRFMAFLFIASLAFVAAWPLFQKDTRRAHYVVAVIAGILSQICVIALQPRMLLLWLVFTSYAFVPSFIAKKAILLAEVVCYAAIVLSVCHAISA